MENAGPDIAPIVNWSKSIGKEMVIVDYTFPGHRHHQYHLVCPEQEKRRRATDGGRWTRSANVNTIGDWVDSLIETVLGGGLFPGHWESNDEWTISISLDKIGIGE